MAAEQLAMLLQLTANIARSAKEGASPQPLRHEEVVDRHAAMVDPASYTASVTPTGFGDMTLTVGAGADSSAIHSAAAALVRVRAGTVLPTA